MKENTFLVLISHLTAAGCFWKLVSAWGQVPENNRWVLWDVIVQAVMIRARMGVVVLDFAVEKQGLEEEDESVLLMSLSGNLLKQGGHPVYFPLSVTCYGQRLTVAGDSPETFLFPYRMIRISLFRRDMWLQIWLQSRLTSHTAVNKTGSTRVVLYSESHF